MFRLLVFVTLLTVPGFCIDLQQHLVEPVVKGESNFYLDLWQPPKMRVIAPGGGLTNNRALFINSHGKRIKTKAGRKFVYYPHAEMGKGEFSIADVAAAMGAEKVATIHNVVISACDMESTFDAKEVRKHFPNATNIIHSARGQAGYQEMLFQMLLAESSQIETLYQTRAPDGTFDFSNRAGSGAKKMSPYVATLFRAGESKSYRTQKAGRELLTNVPMSDVVALTTLE